MSAAKLDRLIARHNAITERILRGGLLDRETDAAHDEQERLEPQIRAAAAPAVVHFGHVRRPWITVHPPD